MRTVPGAISTPTILSILQEISFLESHELTQSPMHWAPAAVCMHEEVWPKLFSQSLGASNLDLVDMFKSSTLSIPGCIYGSVVWYIIDTVLPMERKMLKFCQTFRAQQRIVILLLMGCRSWNVCSGDSWWLKGKVNKRKYNVWFNEHTSWSS